MASASLKFSFGTAVKPTPLHIKINQPRDVVTPLYTVSNVNGKATLTWNKNFKQNKEEKYITAQEFLDGEVLRDCEPYIPLLTGVLIFSGITGSKLGSGLVQWTTPYARRQYYRGRYPGENFSGPLRGRLWFKRSKEVNLNKWLDGVRVLAARNG